jgi:spore coat polysaccharide biosynthesis protein SpsF
MGSSRLPGKVLMEIAGRAMLSHVIERANRSERLDDLWIATSITSQDDPIAALAEAEGVGLYRGSLEDVLGRFVKAAESACADIVVRLTGDSPLVEPMYIRMAVDLHFAAGADLTCGRDSDQIVPGTGCEVVNLPILQTASQKGHSSEDREHVTWYLLANHDRFKVEFLRAKEGWKNPGIRLAVDEAEDLALIREIYERLGSRNTKFGLAEILDLYAQEPLMFQRNVGFKHARTSFGGHLLNLQPQPGYWKCA